MASPEIYENITAIRHVMFSNFLINQIFFSVILLLILILPLLVVFYLSYNYVKQQKAEASKVQTKEDIKKDGKDNF